MGLFLFHMGLAMGPVNTHFSCTHYGTFDKLWWRRLYLWQNLQVLTLPYSPGFCHHMDFGIHRMLNKIPWLRLMDKCTPWWLCQKSKNLWQEFTVPSKELACSWGLNDHCPEYRISSYAFHAPHSNRAQLHFLFRTHVKIYWLRQRQATMSLQ